MADAEEFPVLLGFYTRELRDRTYRWLQKLYPLKKAIKLDSPLEDLGRLHPDFHEQAFFEYLMDRNNSEYFGRSLRAYLEYTHQVEDDNSPEMEHVKDIVRTYDRPARKFRKKLQGFFGGHYDIVLTSQQGLLLRIMYSSKFSIPDHIDVIFDELELGLWTDGESSPSFINKAVDSLRAGGAWTILTGDLRPLMRMPNEFRVVNLTRKQFISPITLRTAMPLGVGRSIQRPFNPNSPSLMRRYDQLVAERNHLNREISLIASPRSRRIARCVNMTSPMGMVSRS